MKHLVSTVILAVTMLLSTQLAADNSILCESICKEVSCKNFNFEGGFFEIIESGAYSLEDDLIGLIQINADTVCLDLKKHTLTSNPNEYAVANVNKGPGIFSNGPQGITCVSVDGVVLDHVSTLESRVLNIDQATGPSPATGIRINSCKDVCVTHCEGSRSFSTGNNAYGIQLTSNQEGVKVTEAKAYANEGQKVGVGLDAQFNQFISVEESCASHNTASANDGVGYGFAFEFNNASEITDSVAKHNKTAGIFIEQLP